MQYEIAYREVGAVIHTEHLWTNLLTSQALTFNLFGPFKQRAALATNVMRRLVPDLADVTEVLFEHSPDRGHPRYTAYRLRCAVPLHYTAGPSRLCRNRGQVLRGARWPRLTRTTPL